MIDTTMKKPALAEIADAPPAPKSAYMLFIKSLKETGQPAQTGIKKNFLQDASKLWGELTDEQKKPFYDQASRMKQDYQEFRAR